MANIKVKKIGVLREREEDGNINEGGGGGDDSHAPTHLPKMSALDLAGILNCRRRLEWTKEWLKKNQEEFLSKENILSDTQMRSNETYHLNCFFHITERQFRHLVNILAPVISSYEPHRKKKFFSAEERIAITLRYLATGEVHSCRNYCFRASKPVILKMISDICLNIYELLRDQFLSFPKTDEQWQNVVNDLQRKNKDIPNCLGNMSMHKVQFHNTLRVEQEDEKPPIIFTTIVDSSNNFMYVDVERCLAKSPDNIYGHSKLKQLIESNTSRLPMPGKNMETNNFYYFAGHGALPVKHYLLNSFRYVPSSKDHSYAWGNGPEHPEFNYNYSMDMVNMHTEYALRILTNLFPILALPLRMEQLHARKVILGCCALYNFLRKTDKSFYIQTEKMNEVEEQINATEHDCILVPNEDEMEERLVCKPIVEVNRCFQVLKKQQGDTAAGLANRVFIMNSIAKSQN